jgi:hypothetical protein
MIDAPFSAVPNIAIKSVKKSALKTKKVMSTEKYNGSLFIKNKTERKKKQKKENRNQKKYAGIIEPVFKY